MDAAESSIGNLYVFHSDTLSGFWEMAQFNLLVKDYLQSARLCWHPVCLITSQAVKLLVRIQREIEKIILAL